MVSLEMILTRGSAPFTDCLSDSRKDRYYEVPTARKIARFVGQSSVLSDIDDNFQSLFTDDYPAPCIVTLVGMGGIGKTQLALEYSKLAFSRKQNTFHDVFWFNASSEETLTTDFMKISTLLAPPDKLFDAVTERVEFVLSTLNSWKTRVLIVFDNFDDPSFTNVLDYLPSTGACGVLFTSRLREAGDEFGNMIAVPLMNKDDALQVLLSRLRLKEVPEDQSADCQRVIDSLGSLPLALEQAGAYMASGGGRMSFREFLQHFETRKDIMMSTTPKFWKYTNISDPNVKSASLSILTTWDLSLDRLGFSSADRAKKTHFLTVLCFLDPNRISRIFFKSYSKLLHELPAYTTGNDWMSIFKSPTELFDENKFRDVVVEMANLSLIRQFCAEVLSNSFVVTLHPLIRDWAQFRQSETERKNFAKEASCVVAGLLIDHHDPVAVIALNSMVPHRHGIDDWQYAIFLRDMMSEILAHMDTCVNHWKALHIKSETTSSDPGDIFAIESLFANAFSALRQFDKSYEMLDRTYSTAVANHGEDHETSLKISLEMCSMKIQQGRGPEVQARLENLVKHGGALAAGDIRFNNHKIAQFWLVSLYRAEGDIGKATKLAKALLTSFLLMDISDDLELKLFLATIFANLLTSLELHEDAQMLRRRMIARYKKKINFSPGSSSNRSKELMSMLELSLVGHLLFLYERDGTMEALEEAESLLRGIDEVTGDHSAPMDKFTLKAYHGLAFAARGLWREAIEQTELAYKYCTAVVGPVHPVTIERMNSLVKQILRSPVKNKGRAVEVITEALDAATEQLGKRHEKVLALQRQSATLLFNEKHRRLALPLYDDLVQTLAQQLDSASPKMMKAHSELAYCLCLLPDRSDAETQRAILLYRNLIKLEQPEPKTKAILKAQVDMRERLGLMLRKVKEFPEAIELYEQALAKQMSLTEKSGPDAWLIQQSIAACYRFQEQPSNALKILKKIEVSQMDTLGITHGDITSDSYAHTLHQMGLCYADLDFDKEPTAYENAKGCYGRVLEFHLRKSNGKLTADAAAVHRFLGDLHRKRGRHMEAAESYERTCQFTRLERGEDFFYDILCLGEVLRLAEAWDKQRAALLERLAWTQEFRGPDSEPNMLSIAVLATNAECLKEIDNSLRYRKEELGLRRKIFEDSPGKMIDCMISIANLSHTLADFETSRSMIAEILQIRSTLDDYDRKDDMRFLADMAAIEVNLKNWDASIGYCRQIIDFYQNDTQEISPHLILAEVHMGLALFALEEFNEAEAHAARSVQMREKLLGEEHLSTIKARFWLAKITFEQRNYEKAALLFDRCIPHLLNLDNPSPYWEQFWEQEISVANVSLKICRAKINR